MLVQEQYPAQSGGMPPATLCASPPKGRYLPCQWFGLWLSGRLWSNAKPCPPHENGLSSCRRGPLRTCSLKQLRIRQILHALVSMPAHVVQHLLEFGPARYLFRLPGVPAQVPGASVPQDPVKQRLPQSYPAVRVSNEPGRPQQGGHLSASNQVLHVTGSAVRVGLNRNGHFKGREVVARGKQAHPSSTMVPGLFHFGNYVCVVAAFGIRERSHSPPKNLFQNILALADFADQIAAVEFGQDGMRDSVCADLKTGIREAPQLAGGQSRAFSQAAARNVKRTPQVSGRKQLCNFKVSAIVIVPTRGNDGNFVRGGIHAWNRRKTRPQLCRCHLNRGEVSGPASCLDRKLVHLFEHQNVAFSGILLLKFLACAVAHCFHFFGMCPGPSDLAGKILRFPRPEVQARSPVRYDLLHRA